MYFPITSFFAGEILMQHLSLSHAMLHKSQNFTVIVSTTLKKRSKVRGQCMPIV
jgi:hypothetical protein